RILSGAQGRSEPDLLHGRARAQSCDRLLDHSPRAQGGGAERGVSRLVLGAMEMSYFDRFFSTVVLGGGGRIRLFRNDGVMLASHPPVDPSAARVLANKQRFAELSEQTKAGTVELVRPVAGEERQIVIEKLGHYPLLLTASRTIDDALAQWRG